MAGLFGGGAPQAASPTRLAGMKIQTSIYGKPRTLVYGTNRVAGNLIWEGDFTAIPVKQSQPSGKGGGSVNSVTTYNYSAAVAIGLCEGPVSSINSITDNNGNVSNVTITEEFTVPVGGGVITVTHSANFAADFGVSQQQPYSVSTSDFGDPDPGTITGTQDVPMELV